MNCAPGEVWLGIDVSKKKLDAAIWVDGKVRTRQEDNTNSGFRLLLAWAQKVVGAGTSLRVCMEATGDYGFCAALFFTEEGLRVSVVNPAWVKFFGRSQGRQNKTDKADAKLLAQYGHERQPAEWHLKNPVLRSLFRLVRRRRQLCDMITAERNRQECPEAIGAECMASIKGVLKGLREERRRIEKQIRALIASSVELSRRYELLRSMAGEISSFVILAELPDVEDCPNPPSYAAGAGVNPAGSKSGEGPQRSKMSRCGSSHVRGVLTLPMLTAKRKMPELHDLYKRLRGRGRTHKQALVACMRKFLMIAYAVQKSGKTYVSRFQAEKLAEAT